MTGPFAALTAREVVVAARLAAGDRNGDPRGLPEAPRGRAMVTLAPAYPAYREPGDRPREYLLDAASAASAPPRPGSAPPTWPLVEAPALVEDVCRDYLVAVDQLRAAEADLAAALDKHRDTTELLAAALRGSVRLQALLTRRDAEIADLRRRLAATGDEVTLVVMAARRSTSSTGRAEEDPLRPPRRRVRWDALDDEIDTRVIDVPIVGDAR